MKIRYDKRCVFCGARVLTESINRKCYKCNSEMIVLKVIRKENGI